MVATTPQQFSQLLSPKLPPDFSAAPANPEIGAVHRHADGGEVYFVANTSPQKQTVQATFRQTGMQPEQWNPLNGKIRPLAVAFQDGHVNHRDAGTRAVRFHSRCVYQPPSAGAGGAATSTIDVSTGWSVKFAGGPGGTVPGDDESIGLLDHAPRHGQLLGRGHL